MIVTKFSYYFAMLIGYARISTDDQKLDLQTDALKKAGCQKIFSDEMSGAKASRPGLDEAISHLREGDTLVVWRLDRLGRSLKNLIDLTELLKERSIGFHSVTEGIDTNTTNGKLMFHLFGALAEFERNLINDRASAGRAAARARGETGGRPKKLDSKQRELAVKMYKEKEHSIKDICSILNISKPALYRYVDADNQLKSKVS